MKMPSPQPHLSSVLALLAVIGTSAAEGPKPADHAPLVLSEFNVARDGDFLFLPVTLQGKKYLFLIDTGATWNVYDRSLPLGKPKGEVVVEAADGLVKLPDRKSTR